MSQNNVGIYASQISGHLWAPNGAMDALATITVPSGGLTSVTFAGIPQGYKHLQLRTTGKSNLTGTNGADFAFQFNGDTAANYKGHQMYGDGANPYAAQETDGTSSLYFGWVSKMGLTNVFAAYITDILNYSDTTKYKTMRSFGGWDGNGSGFQINRSGSWRSTAGINSITIISPSGSIAQYSQFALYGVK